MNSIQKINSINQRELETNTTDAASWHADFKDTAYIYIGFIPQELEEMDIIKIFSQYGIPTHINLIRDRETKKSRGFCYLKYEDHRSCILAIDNFNGIQVLDKKLKVDHVYYKLQEGQSEDDFIIDYSQAISELKHEAIEGKEKKLLENPREDFKDPMEEFKDPMDDFKDPMDDFRDPMEEYLIRDKKKSDTRKHRSRHNRNHSHRIHKTGHSRRSSKSEAKA